MSAQTEERTIDCQLCGEGYHGEFISAYLTEVQFAGERYTLCQEGCAERVAEVAPKRHGGPFDRGSADYYYWRPPNPHYYVGATGRSQRVEEEDMTPEEIAEYHRGYAWETDRKDFG